MKNLEYNFSLRVTLASVHSAPSGKTRRTGHKNETRCNNPSASVASDFEAEMITSLEPLRSNIGESDDIGHDLRYDSATRGCDEAESKLVRRVGMIQRL